MLLTCPKKKFCAALATILRRLAKHTVVVVISHCLRGVVLKIICLFVSPIVWFVVVQWKSRKNIPNRDQI